MTTSQMIFGYGSLVVTPGFIPSRAPDACGYSCDLTCHRRRFGVAMDNTATISGYKYFTDSATGERPVAFVAFLDVYEIEGGAVNGLVFPVTDDDLAALDRRERNYVRVDVTAAIRPEPQDTVWAFVGSPQGRARFDEGARAGSAIVSADYLRAVREGFERLGPDEAARFAASTDPPACPVRELTRIDLGP